jgi:hypothetical protein
MFVILPLWFAVLVWLIGYPARRRESYKAALAANPHAPPPSPWLMLLWWIFVAGPFLWLGWQIWSPLFGATP